MKLIFHPDDVRILEDHNGWTLGYEVDIPDEPVKPVPPEEPVPPGFEELFQYCSVCHVAIPERDLRGHYAWHRECT